MIYVNVYYGGFVSGENGVNGGDIDVHVVVGNDV